MKLKRESIKDSEVKGKWYFCIYDKNPEALEAAEDRLAAVLCDHSINNVQMTWGDYCDFCPSYEDGFGSGFWIDIDDVEEFKQAWRSVK